MVSFRIVRIRPLAELSEGLSKHDLLRAAAAYAGAGARGERVNIVFPGVLNSPVAERIRDALEDGIRAATVILLDINISPDFPRYSFLDLILANMLSEMTGALSGDHKIVFLTPVPPSPNDKLFELAMSSSFSGLIYFVSREGQMTPDSPREPRTRLARIARIVEADSRDVRSDFAARLVRRRGVFVAPGEDRGGYYHFSYSGELCEPELQILLKRFLQESGSTTVVFAPGATWFVNSVLYACGALGIEAYCADDDLDDGVCARISADLRAGRRCGVVIPAYRLGRGLRVVMERMQVDSMDGLDILSVLVDSSLGEVEWKDEHGVAPIRFDGEARQLSFFAQVDLPPLEQSNWRVAVATALGEVQPTNGPRIPRLREPIWDLLLALGTAPERLPVDGIQLTRRRVEHFPDLRNLDNEDALWLAEALIDQVIQELGCERENLLVLLPDYDNSSRKIAQAIELRLRMAAHLVPAGCIWFGDPLPIEVEAAIRDFAPESIAVADECAVSYSTIRRLSDVVNRVAKEAPQGRAVVFDLGSREIPVLSLTNWQPLRWTEARDG